MKKYLNKLFILLLVLVSSGVKAQLCAGGNPESFYNGELSGKYQTVSITPPDLSVLADEDQLNDSASLPRRIGQLIPVGLNPQTAGTWEYPVNGDRVWRLNLHSDGALALSLYFSVFFLPPGVKMFLYDKNEQQLKGAFTYLNNDSSRLFATEMVYGEDVTIELDVPSYTEDSLALQISELGYGYRDIPQYFAGKGFGGSDPCEVNVNCSPEGDSWQDEKRGVIRIKVKVSKSEFWCTGSLINNVRNDQTPYLLTADHCAFQNSHYASAADINQWVFYFNYETSGCDNPVTEPGLFSLTGATKVASGGHRGTDGSDFFLVMLKNNVPENYSPYFNGWSLSNSPGTNGVTIQHPEGDIKKISTYTTTPVTSSWNSNGLPSHWKVFWSQTANNWGVTEPGSSGCPLFDENGRIIGTLTGGQASCSTQTLPDYFGKFSYHWQSNGSNDTTQLKPWLDPDNTGVNFLNGISVDVQQHQMANVGDVVIYPNPAHDYVNIKFINFEPLNFQISFINVLGQKVREINVKGLQQNVKVNTNEMDPGIYCIQIRTGDKEMVGSLIKE